MNKTPANVPAADPDQRSTEPTNVEPLNTRPKAAFQWPPDCLWPFLNRGWDSET